MRLRRIVGMLLLLVVCCFSSMAGAENAGYEFYFQQLDANQQAMYRVIQAAPAETASYTVELPEAGVSQDGIASKLQTTMETVKMDHPESTAWLFWFENCSYDEECNAVTFTLICSDYYDPDDQTMSEKLIDTIVAAADPSWDLYTKARFISNAVIDALEYDWNYVFYGENGKADYYNSNIYCVNNGFGICGGFSKLYKAVADRIDLPCVEVGSVGHAWVHVKMEDGNWYGIDPQDPNILQGTDSMLGWYYLGGNDMYELYDGFFAEDGSIKQPERAKDDYEYIGVEPNPGSVDLAEPRQEGSLEETTLTYTVNADGTSCTITGFRGGETGDLVIPETLDGYTVTAIGNSAFAYAKFDGTLTLPDTVETIYSQAFARCTGLKGTLKLPANLKLLGGAAFIECTGLTGEIEFGDRIEEIRGGAFANCTGVTGSLWLPDSLSSIWGNAFYNCDGLDGVVHIPDSIANWSADCIDDCNNLSGFDVSENHAFYQVYDGLLYNREMTTLLTCINGYSGAVVIPEGVEVIEYAALYMCQKVTSVKFPSTLKRIEAWGCGYLTGLTEMPVLPASLEYLGNNAFCCSSMPGTLILPCDIEMGEDAFGAMMNLERLIIAEGVTKLPANAFLSGVREVIFPSTIQEIGENCFNDNWDLVIYGYPGTCVEAFVSAEKIDMYHWDYVPMVDGIALSKDELALALDAGGGECQHQLSVIPDANGKTVTWASADESVATVVNGLVSSVSTGTTTITAKVGETTLTCRVSVYGEVRYSADGKTLLKVSESYTGELLIPEGVENIGAHAINSVGELTKITFPSTLKTLGVWALYGLGYTHDLSLVLPETVTSVSNNAFINNRFEYFRYPVCAQIGTDAFMMNTIAVLDIPEGVTTIPEGAFGNCQITSCYLPASLESAPLNAFQFASVQTFYGYSNTYAQSYVAQLQAKYPDQCFQFVSMGEPMNCSACMLEAGETMQLTWKEGGTWTSSNALVASVDENGLVCAMGDGVAYVTCTAADGTYASCRVVVGAKRIAGDVNEDGVLDMLDIIDLMEWYCDGAVEINLAYGDVNADSVIDMLDIILMMEAYCGAEVTLVCLQEEVPQ